MGLAVGSARCLHFSCPSAIPIAELFAVADSAHIARASSTGFLPQIELSCQPQIPSTIFSRLGTGFHQADPSTSASRLAKNRFTHGHTTRTPAPASRLHDACAGWRWLALSACLLAWLSALLKLGLLCLLPAGSLLGSLLSAASLPAGWLLPACWLGKSKNKKRAKSLLPAGCWLLPASAQAWPAALLLLLPQKYCLPAA